jgi:hypothetical protein
VSHATQRTFQGRVYLVAPVVMLKADQPITSGQGRTVRYPASLLRSTARQWNGKAVTLAHPTADGAFVAAGHSPEVYDKHAAGQLWNVRFDEDKQALVGEAWIDRQRLGQLSPGLAYAIDTLQVRPVSTGLYVDSDAGGTARHLAADHLAIVLEGEGSCSTAMGCGLNLNAAAPGSGGFLPLPDIYAKSPQGVG